AVVTAHQSPIGKSPRSNPVTYMKALDVLRGIYAARPLATERGYKPGTFSFNVPGGRCEPCEGDGVVRVEMYFLADLFVPCDECGGLRYKRDVLDVRVHGLNIREALDLTVDEAIARFHEQTALVGRLSVPSRGRLGYFRLGPPAPTFSGGRVPRLQLAPP